MPSDSVPNDVMMEIMVRLPVKSLLRFKSVSKSWYALITDHSFITKQLAWSKSITKICRRKLMFYIHNPNPRPSIFMISFREQPCVVQDVGLPFPKNDLKSISIYGQCNGILCLSGVYQLGDVHGTSYEQRQLLLWNPSTKEVKAIPAKSQSQSKGSDKVKFGFGYDHITKDYKVAQFPIRPLEGEQSLVELYNLSTNSWRTIEVDVPIFNYLSSYKGSYLNGAYHCLTLDPHTVDNFIVRFDFSEEVFRVMQLPPGISSRVATVGAVDGNFACVCSCRNQAFEIWIKNQCPVESSWTKKFEIALLPNFRQVLGFLSENELLVKENHGGLMSYNLENQHIHKFQTTHVLPQALTSMSNYVESLVPLNDWGKHNRI